jgi:hypothetical protein
MKDNDLDHQRLEFFDQQNELAGAGHKISRFYSEDKTERGKREKASKRNVEQILDALSQMRLDPAYEAAFQAANTAIDDAQTVLDQALLTNSELITDLEDRAAKLPDGRAVFLREDGTGETKDGEIIPIQIMITLDISDDAPTITEYNAARERRRELGGFGEDIEKARTVVNNPTNPASVDKLEDLTKDMDKLKREIEGTYNPTADFNSVAPPDVADLDFGSIPKPPR